jgi:phage terminase small subunit
MNNPDKPAHSWAGFFICAGWRKLVGMGLKKIYDIGAQPRFDRFVEEYFANNCNAGAAAIACGYKASSNVARSLMHNPYVVKRIQERAAQLRERNDVNLDRIIVELSHIAFFDIGKIYDQAGRLRPLHTLTAAVRAGIAGVESEEIYGLDGALAGMQRKVKVVDRVRAMELLAKLLGYVEKVQVDLTGQGGAATHRIIFEDLTAPAEVPITQHVEIKSLPDGQY